MNMNTSSSLLNCFGKTFQSLIAEGKASIEAKFTVNRADWGIKFGTDETDPAEWMISKDIEIGVNVTASK